MKAKNSPQPLKKLRRRSPFAIPAADWSHEKELTDLVTLIVAAKPRPNASQSPADTTVSTDHLKAVVSIANNFWRARKRMLDPVAGEVREDMKRIYRDIEAVRRSLAGVGIVICYHRDDDFDEGDPKVRIIVRDHTGDPYDEGQPMKVIASKPTPGQDKKRVSETLLPSIFWNNQLIQNGEIEIATPPPSNTSPESQATQA